MADKTINPKEFQTLISLAFLFLNTGDIEKAQKIYLALLKMTSEKKHTMQVYKSLAFVCLRKKDYTACLDYLREALDNEVIKSKDAVLYLLKAEALWHLERKQEADNALQQYYSYIS